MSKELLFVLISLSVHIHIYRLKEERPDKIRHQHKDKYRSLLVK